MTLQDPIRNPSDMALQAHHQPINELVRASRFTEDLIDAPSS